MTTIITLASLIPLGAFIWGAALAIFAKGRRAKGLKISGASIVLFLALSITAAYLNDRAAKDLGFNSYSDQLAAREANITDPIKWAELREKHAEERARIASELKAEADQLAKEEEDRRAKEAEAQKRAEMIQKYPPTTTLQQYADLGVDQRAEMISVHAEALAASNDDLEHFQNCMGDFASNKNPELTFKEVFSWCENERQTNRSAFESHYNEIAAKDVSTMAGVICKGITDNMLVAPATASHPWVPTGVWNMGKGKFVVKSYVDSQNSFGAMIRTKYRCEVQYDGSGDKYSSTSWDVLDYTTE